MAEFPDIQKENALATCPPGFRRTHDGTYTWRKVHGEHSLNGEPYPSLEPEVSERIWYNPLTGEGGFNNTDYIVTGSPELKQGVLHGYPALQAMYFPVDADGSLGWSSLRVASRCKEFSLHGGVVNVEGV